MTYLHTSPTDPTAPMWMFHLPTFTLAQLHLGAGPDGNHLLTIDAATPPPDEVIATFAATLDTMAAGASAWLSVVTREGIAKDLPEFMHFAPDKPDPRVRFLTLSPRQGFAHIAHPWPMEYTICWKNKPLPYPKEFDLRRAAVRFDAQQAARQAT